MHTKINIYNNSPNPTLFLFSETFQIFIRIQSKFLHSLIYQKIIYIENRSDQKRKLNLFLYS